MKNENAKYFVLPVIMLIAFLAWYYWDKIRDIAAVATAKATGSAVPVTAQTTASTIAAGITPGAVAKKPYVYGNADMYFNFSGDTANRSAFKPLN